MSVLKEIYKLLASGMVCDARAEMRANGATPQEIEAATERIVRHHVEPHVPHEKFWPENLLLPTCAYCGGTGFVMSRNVENRLKCKVDEGVPCRCARGNRFLKPIPGGPDDDFRQAAKTGKPKPKGFSRFGS